MEDVVCCLNKYTLNFLDQMQCDVPLLQRPNGTDFLPISCLILQSKNVTSGNQSADLLGKRQGIWKNQLPWLVCS